MQSVYSPAPMDWVALVWFICLMIYLMSKFPHKDDSEIGNKHDDPISKSWTGLFAFSHSADTLGKGMHLIILFQLWVRSRVGWILKPWYGNQSRSRTLNSNQLDSSLKKIDNVSYPLCAENLGKYIFMKRQYFSTLAWNLIPANKCSIASRIICMR